MWWMYSVERFFPYLYSLMEIERKKLEKKKEAEMKEKLRKKYISISYLKKYDIDMIEKLKEQNVMEGYESILIKYGFTISHKEEEILNKLLEYIDEIDTN